MPPRRGGGKGEPPPLPCLAEEEQGMEGVVTTAGRTEMVLPPSSPLPCSARRKNWASVYRSATSAVAGEEEGWRASSPLLAERKWCFRQALRCLAPPEGRTGRPSIVLPPAPLPEKKSRRSSATAIHHWKKNRRTAAAFVARGLVVVCFRRTMNGDPLTHATGLLRRMTPEAEKDASEKAAVDACRRDKLEKSGELPGSK
nr:hypothetical protein Itr_chr13CG15470 [Ipomoea trifida]